MGTGPLASMPKTACKEAGPEGQKCCIQTSLLKTWDAKNKLHHIRVKLPSWELLEFSACFYMFFPLIQVTTVARTTSPLHRWCQTLSPTCLQAELPFMRDLGAIVPGRTCYFLFSWCTRSMGKCISTANQILVFTWQNLGLIPLEVT